MLFKTLITMKPSSKGISLLLILDTSSNLKKPAKDKTYIATLRNSAGLSRSDLLIISWIKVAEIGSLRLRSRSFMRVKGSYLQDLFVDLLSLLLFFWLLTQSFFH